MNKQSELEQCYICTEKDTLPVQSSISIETLLMVLCVMSIVQVVFNLAMMGMMTYLLTR